MNCASCGAALPERALFCGKCGRAVTAVTTPRARIVDPRPGDTVVIRPTSRWVFADLGGGGTDQGAAGGADASQEVPAEPDAPAPEAADVPTPVASGEPSSAVTAPPDDEDDAVDPSDSADPARAGGAAADPPRSGWETRSLAADDLPAPRSASSVRARYADDAASASARSAWHDDDRRVGRSASEIPTEESPIVPSSGGAAPAAQPHGAPVPHVLSFSTGERVVVVGAGLLGRRPYPQPTERFDQLVSIADDERSVSKTHLEFGLESGELWVCDRYSANGTVIIPPAGAPHRCEPGRRYRVPRGGRVEIGDHWFDVR